MDYYRTSDQQMLAAQKMIPERRTAPRRPLRQRVVLGFANGAPVSTQAVDLSEGGMRIAVPDKVATDQECSVEFNVMIGGRSRPVRALGRILSCVCTGMDGFSIGIQFTQVDEDSKSVIAQYVR